MNKIICAIDTNDLDKAKRIASLNKEEVFAVKLGLEFFTSHGISGVQKVIDLGTPVFLDLKLHDIPNTVAGAIKSCILGLDLSMLTIHITGGKTMLKTAVDITQDTAWRIGHKKPLILGVTCLTSLDHNDLKDFGINNSITDHIVDLARIGKDCGLDGVICPAFEIEDIRQHCGENFKIVVPGIRPKNYDSNDQKRFLTPKEAIKSGADYIVVGRPITQSSDPLKVIQEINDEINSLDLAA